MAKLNFYTMERPPVKPEERSFILPNGETLTLRLKPVTNLEYAQGAVRAEELMEMSNAGAKFDFGGILSPPLTFHMSQQIGTLWACQDFSLPEDEIYDIVELVGLCEQSGAVWDEIHAFAQEQLMKLVTQKKTEKPASESSPSASHEG